MTCAVPVVDLTSMTILDKMYLQGEAWIGYFQTYEHFLFIVCVPLSEIKSSISATYNIGRPENRPGICYSLCGLQGYIGLQAGVCYCIAERTFSTPGMHSVNNSCENPYHCETSMLCGNQGHIKISVYKKVFMSSSISGNGSGCLMVSNRSEYQMSVASCKGNFRHLCESNTGQFLHLEESPVKEHWVYSILQCAKTGKKPTTFIGNGTNFIFPNSSGPWWTSVVRDLITRNCSESMTIQEKPSYEGFVKNSNDVIKLEFVHAEEYSRKTFVACMSEQPINEEDNRTEKPAEPTITSAQISVLTVILPIGLAALVLIAVVALSIVCCRRRKEKDTNNEGASKLKSTETSVPRNSEIQQTYDEHERERINRLEESDQGHVSSVYDSLNEYDVRLTVPTVNLYDTSNINNNDGTYAVTFSASTLRQEVHANYYDHVRMNKTNDGNYDHVELQDQKNSVNDIDTYDHGKDLALDNTYYDMLHKNVKLQ
ncbi:hypothetical protein ACJMK2_022776 [Sinanodonta woodiana]|uniref:WSC domain-containing protein n=1 Tax=Sinanodonta woodiana TaxID=1069815 RepID=A0ABD3TKW8_SINWO